MNDCGNLCQQTCEDHLSGGKLCLEICAPPACMCPRGLVLFRDRCVDPRLCYVLMQCKCFYCSTLYNMWYTHGVGIVSCVLMVLYHVIYSWWWYCIMWYTHDGGIVSCDILMMVVLYHVIYSWWWYCIMWYTHDGGIVSCDILMIMIMMYFLSVVDQPAINPLPLLVSVCV